MQSELSSIATATDALLRAVAEVWQENGDQIEAAHEVPVTVESGLIGVGKSAHPALAESRSSARLGAGGEGTASEAAEIRARIQTWVGSAEEASRWCRSQPVAAFGDRTGESLVKSGQADALRDYLDSIALGGYA